MCDNNVPSSSDRKSSKWYSNVHSGGHYLHMLQYKEYDVENIYFFEVNTKYISSNVLKISVISRVRSTSEISDIFNI